MQDVMSILNGLRRPRLLIRAADSPIREVEMALFSQGRVCIPPRGLLSYCVDRR